MRQAWISGWLAGVVAVGVSHCAIDDRSPQQVTPAQRPDGAANSSSTPSPDAGTTIEGSGGNGSNGNGNAGDGSGGASGSNSPTSMPGSNTGNAGGAPGSAGSEGAVPSSAGSQGNAAGAGPAGNAGAGASGTAGPTGSAGTTGASGLDDPLNVGSSEVCPAFDACGGELEGTWSYGDVCIDPASTSIGLLQGLCPSASLQFERRSGSTLTFANAQVSRAAAPVGDSVITFPRDCAADLGGCATLGQLLEGSALCTDMNGDCACRTPGSVDWGMQAYTTNGGQLLLDDGRSFAYCVEGNRLTYRETGDAVEIGTFTLQRNQ